jgi:hypothetical protein
MTRPTLSQEVSMIFVFALFLRASLPPGLHL